MVPASASSLQQKAATSREQPLFERGDACTFGTTESFPPGAFHLTE